MEARLAAADALLSWVVASGGEPNVRLAADSHGGVRMVASADIASGEAAFSCPVRLLLTPAVALEELPALRKAHPLLCDRWRVILLLMHARQKREASFWAPYVQSLPGDELPASLPLHWPEATRSALLRGTPLLTRGAREWHAEVTRFHAEVVSPLCERDPETFPSDDFAFPLLCWAHAVFWSRAICVDGLPGGRQECLVPLLDMANHRPGCTSQLAVERRPASGDGGSTAGASLAAGALHHYALRVSQRVPAGEEVSINYGAKGNGELLRYHGFVIEGNPADVAELDLAPLTADNERLALARAMRRGFLRPFLFAGGLPDGLLPAARMLCAAPGAELEAALATARGEAPPAARGDDECTEEANGGGCGGGGGGTAGGGFDWSLVDWSAEDPFAAANAAAAAAEPPAGRACETRTLDALRRLLSHRLEELPPAEAAADELAAESGVPSAGAAAEAAESARTYLAGQRALLEEAASRLGALRDQLDTRSSAASARGRAEDAPRGSCPKRQRSAREGEDVHAA